MYLCVKGIMTIKGGCKPRVTQTLDPHQHCTHIELKINQIKGLRPRKRKYSNNYKNNMMDFFFHWFI
jgi:hypothetical protein